MRKPVQWAALFAAVLGLLTFTACKQSKIEPINVTDAQTVEAAQKLPDGTNVLAALDQKDYEGAVTGLTKIQQSIGEGSDLDSQYLTLKLHVKNKLLELSATDPKANDALNAVRALTQGR